MLYMITLAFANLVRTTVTVGELLIWVAMTLSTASIGYWIFGDANPDELIRLKLYCSAILNFVLWFLFLVVIGVFGKSNDIKVNKDE